MNPNMLRHYSYVIGSGTLTTEPYTMEQIPSCGFVPVCEIYPMLPTGMIHNEAAETITVTDEALPGEYSVTPICRVSYFNLQFEETHELISETNYQITVL